MSVESESTVSPTLAALDFEGAEAQECASKEDWLAARSAGLGASDAPIILGLSPWKTPLQLYCEKKGLIVPDARETEAMEWGNLLEGPIAARYGDKTGRGIRRPRPFTIYRSLEIGFLSATFDAVTEERGDPGVVEVKNVGQFKAEEWEDEPPLMYQVQLQHQLRVSGWAWGSLAALIGGQRFVWFDIQRNDRFIAVLLEQEAAFWDRIQKDAPPQVTATDARLVGLLYPVQEPGAQIALPAAAAGWDEQRRYADEQIKALKTVKDEAEALLKASIGAAEIGILPDGAAYTWKKVDRKGYLVEPTTYRELRRKAAK